MIKEKFVKFVESVRATTVEDKEGDQEEDVMHLKKIYLLINLYC